MERPLARKKAGRRGGIDLGCPDALGEATEEMRETASVYGLTTPLPLRYPCHPCYPWLDKGSSPITGGNDGSISNIQHGISNVQVTENGRRLDGGNGDGSISNIQHGPV